MRENYGDSYLKTLSRAIGIYLVMAVVGALTSLPAHALDPPSLAPPKGEVILIIDGNITISNSTKNNKPVAAFDLAMLMSLGQTSLTTSSPWSVKSHYTGVRLSSLLEAVGADHKNSIVRATALNDYWFDLEDLKLDQYPIIVAYEKDDKVLTVREMGPLWIVFPWDAHPWMLKSEKIKASSVWQLLSLTVR